MATLREVRRKIRSAANIKKITQAMEMVAASHLRRAQIKAEQFRPYFRQMKEMLDTLIAASDELSHPLLVPRQVKKVGVVVIAADRGLCGAYNYAVFSATEKFLKKYANDQIVLVTVGRKSVDYFAGKKWTIADKLTDWGGKITHPEIVAFTKKLIDMYLKGEVDEIHFVYTHYITVASREVRIEKFLNFEETEEISPKKTQETIFEPDAASVLADLIPQYCSTRLQQALNEAYASELAARIFSMRAATKNAEEMIEKLTLARNKVRQATITRELIEISGCVENQS